MKMEKAPFRADIAEGPSDYGHYGYIRRTTSG